MTTYAYIDSADDVVAIGNVLHDPADIKADAVQRLDNVPDSVVARDLETPDATAYHRYIPANGDGTDISHYELLQDLAGYKNRRLEEIDTRTRELIDTGFEFDGEVFSLSIQSQINWKRLRTSILTGVLTDLDFPRTEATLNHGEYTLNRVSHASDFYAAYANRLDQRLRAGRSLKSQIKAATTKAEIDAVVDDRQETDPPDDTFSAKRQELLTANYVDWKYEVIEKSGGRIDSVSRYTTDNGDGTYSGLVQEMLYSYQGNKLLSVETNTYDGDGELLATETETFFTDGSSTVRKFS